MARKKDTRDMTPQKRRAASSPKDHTRRNAHRHGRAISSECKHLVMSVLHTVNRPLAPMEIFGIARATTGTRRQPGSIAVACTQLEQQGHVLSVPGDEGDPSLHATTRQHRALWLAREIQAPSSHGRGRCGPRPRI